MDYKKFEQIIRFVETSGEKFIVVLEGSVEPVVVVPFSSFEKMYRKENTGMALAQDTGHLETLTKTLRVDTIEPISKYAESREKPQHIKQVIEERTKAGFSDIVSKKDETPQPVSEEDRYYFEPVE